MRAAGRQYTRWSVISGSVIGSTGSWRKAARNSLGNRAVILHDRGDLDGAMALHKEKEWICRELGDPAGLARTLGNQALILEKIGQRREAMPLAEEAYRLASQHGLTALADQIQPVLDRLQVGG